MAIDDDARDFVKGYWRIRSDRLESDDFEGMADEAGMDREDWQRLCLLLDRIHSEADDERLMDNWNAVKGEIVGGRIYGFVRSNFPELSHELLGSADLWGGKYYVGNLSVVTEENALSTVPFAFNSKLADEIVSSIQLACDRETLRREIKMALKRERWRRRIVRPAIRALAYIGIVLLAIVLWKLLKVVL